MRAVLWCCIALFFARVVGQAEAWLLEPSWLPPANAWYSGLLPYPVLLPAQIALLMAMSVLAVRGRVRSTRIALALRSLAVFYFIAMVVRLALDVQTHGAAFYLHGAIPIGFHWVLALFLLVLARAPDVVGSPPASRQGRDSGR